MSAPGPSAFGGAGEDGRAVSESWLDRLRARLGLRGTASFRTDISDALEDSSSGEEFTLQERALLKNVLAIRDFRVKDVMVPRADVIAVPAEITIGDLLRVFRTAGHSRLPVHGETLDDPKGMVHIRDFLDHLASRSQAGRRRRKKGEEGTPEVVNIELSAPLATAKLMRPILYAPPSMPALDLLVRMQATRTHIALVIDEYGGTDGLVSMEDLMEVIVGDIEDEHDEADPQVQTLPDGSWLTDARLPLDEAEEAFGVTLRDAENPDEIDTIGGLIVSRAGRVPVRSEVIAGPGDLEFEVIDADPRRIKRVKVHRRAAAAPDPPASAVPPPELQPARTE